MYNCPLPLIHVLAYGLAVPFRAATAFQSCLLTRSKSSSSTLANLPLSNGINRIILNHLTPAGSFGKASFPPARLQGVEPDERIRHKDWSVGRRAGSDPRAVPSRRVQ